MTKKVLLLGVRPRQSSARPEKENQSSGTLQKNGEDGSRSSAHLTQAAHTPSPQKNTERKVHVVLCQHKRLTEEFSSPLGYFTLDYLRFIKKVQLQIMWAYLSAKHCEHTLIFGLNYICSVLAHLIYIINFGQKYREHYPNAI